MSTTPFRIDPGAASPDRIRRNFQHLADFIASTAASPASTFFVAPLNASISTSSGGTSTRIAVRISSTAGNKLVLLADGLYIST